MHASVQIHGEAMLTLNVVIRSDMNMGTLICGVEASWLQLCYHFANCMLMCNMHVYVMCTHTHTHMIVQIIVALNNFFTIPVSY